MAAQLSKLKGKFILSINEVPEIRDLFQEFNIEETDVQYSQGNKGRRKFLELIIQN